MAAITLPGLFGRLILAGKSCCRSNPFAVYKSNHQYLPTRSAITRRVYFHAVSFAKQTNFSQIVRRRCTGPPIKSGAASESPSPAKMSLFARFKSMYKDYWYVLVPVHVITSIGWFGASYKISTSGVDIGYYLKKIGVKDSLVEHITESGMGHVAVAYALYKIATPARYALTLVRVPVPAIDELIGYISSFSQSARRLQGQELSLSEEEGGTTLSINVLRNMGYIKPAKELMAKGRTKIQSIKDKQLPKE